MQYITRELINSLPKPETHTHLDGSVNPQEIYSAINRMSLEERAKAQVEIRQDLVERITGLGNSREYAETYLRKQYDTIDFGNIQSDEIERFMVLEQDCTSLTDFLIKFPFPLHFMQSEDGLYRITKRYIQDNAEDGIDYVELRFAPTHHRRRGLSDKDILNAVSTALRDAEDEFGVKSGIIVSGERHLEGDVEEAVDIVLRNRDYPVVAFDIAGAENGFPVKNFREAMDKLHAEGIYTTHHAGEAYGPDSIRQAIKYGHANRIGHGTSIMEDMALATEFAESGTPIEVCITSNTLTTDIEFEDHPVKDFVYTGLNFFLNTDDRTIINITLTDEYHKAAYTFGWDINTVVQIMLNGYRSAFLPEAEKAELLQGAKDKIRKLVPDIRI